MDLPDQPLYIGEHPAFAEEAQRVTLWWMLAALSDEWPYGIDQAPALGYLEDASIYPAIRAVSEGDERTATETLMPRVSFPPSLDLAARQLFAVLDEHDYTRLIQLLDTRRALQVHCRRLSPEDYLILCKTTGVSTRTVWSAMQRLLAAGPSVTAECHKLAGDQSR